MKVEIKVPNFGESILEATISQVLKSKGAYVEANEEILELETDKVNQILPAPDSGTLDLQVKVGDVVKVGQVIGTIDTEGKKEASSKDNKDEKLSENGAQEEKKERPSTEQKKPIKEEQSSSRKTKQDFVDELGKSESKQSVSENKKTGDENRGAFSQKEPSPSTEKGRPLSEEGRETRKKMSSLRKVIAQRLLEAKHSTAMLTTFNEVDLSEVIALRQKEKENFEKRHKVRLGFMSFFVKACVAALQEFPDINAYIDGEDIVYRNYYDIGIAVGTEKGLFVPVIRDCDKKSYAEIEKELKEFSEKAKKGTIALDDLKGGGFTISNGGVYGSLLSTPILNPPQSGILGMHNIQKRAVVIEDQIVIRPMMYLALSYDHRIVDGKQSIEFLLHIKKNLEEPTRSLLDLGV